MTPRLPPVDPDRLTEEQQRVYRTIAGSRGRVAGPFTALLVSPELADRVQHLGAFIRYDSSLEPRLSELAILVIARAVDSAFEWTAHEPHALRAGVRPEVIEAIRADRRPDGLAADAAAVHDYTRELVAGDVTDATYDTARDTIGTVGVVELTVLIGYYRLLATTLRAHRLEPTDGL
ncbi:MAG TPA: carboxymuconolactone decarboxylase family protein [Actinophytocola sp.]|nr:carboxymuconolactone decarboxylase family protein [Actinophytocola sp.]